ncbi:MAG: hypothetical protein ABI620_09275 [Chloroflexota bacterium]
MEPSGVISSLRKPSMRARLALGVVVALTAAAACQTPAATPSATAGASAPASPSAATQAPTASPDAGMGGLFHVVGTAPAIARSAFPDRGAVLPAAVTVGADGTYHAWVIAFASTPGMQDLHHLTSPDGVAWTEVADASLEGLSAGLGNPGAMPTSVFADGDGWVMYHTGTLASERQGWDIWRATAPGPNGPWTRADAPVLRRGPAGAWDSGALDFPSVFATATGYTMVYSGQDSAHPDGGAIGLATSTDGIAWTKHDDPATTDGLGVESDPVARPGLCGGFDDRAIHQPRIVAQPDRLVMAYAAYTGALDSRASIGYADSIDGGLTWGCEWPAPALDTTGLPSGFVHTVTAFQRGERVALLVEWLADNGTDVWLADLGVAP